MNKLTFLCLMSIFFIAATCAKTPKDQAKEKTCIDESKINPDGICTMQYDPVCGCDGKTYSNDCVATHAGVTQWTKGPCEDKTKIEKEPKIEAEPIKEQKSDLCIDKSNIRKQPCPDIYQPVCGCDGKTYSNKCEAKNKGLTSWTPGKCS